MNPKVERAVQLLLLVKGSTLYLKEATDIIELVVRDPARVRLALEEAQKRGLIKRDGKLVTISKPVGHVTFDYPRIERKKCEDSCTRCGRTITSCQYLVLGPGDEIGPFGSECIKKLGLGQ